MIKTESIFKVTRVLCWETGQGRIHFIKAYDAAHALRIANRLYPDVVSVKEC